MKILIHTDEYWPTCKACAYRMKIFADVFCENKNKVIILTSSINKTTDAQKIGMEKIVYAPTIPMKKKTTVMRMFNNISFAISSIFKARDIGKVDVVLTTSPPPLISISGWIIAKMKGAKLVYDVRDIWPDIALEMNSFSENSFYCKIFRVITNFMYDHADIITTVSLGKAEKIKTKLKKQNTDKVWLVENGFDEEVLKFKIDEDIIKKYELDRKFTCVYVGNVGLAQGLDTLLDIAKKTKHKEVQFLIFGDGAEKEKIAERAKRENLKNVKLCGILNHEKVTTVLQNANMSYIPLKNANMKDSVPTKVYEALGIGCPVLLVAEGEACDLVNETELGVCVSPDRLENLTKAFDEFVTNYAIYSGKQDNARKLMCEKYSRQKIADIFEKRLKKLIG